MREPKETKRFTSMRAIILIAFAAFKASEAVCPNSPCFSWNSPLSGLDPSSSLSSMLSSHQSDSPCQSEHPFSHPLLEKLTHTFGLASSSAATAAATTPHIKTVPVVENHVGHKIVKVIRHVPVLVKETKPELVVRTHHVPLLKHVPVTEKCIRQVERPVIRRVPVVHKTIRPYTYQTVRHVPVPVNPCCPSQMFPHAMSGLTMKAKCPKSVQQCQEQHSFNDILHRFPAQLCSE